MKIKLIDDLTSESENSVRQQSSVIIDGVKHNGYVIAKPLNYDKKHLSLKSRFQMAKLVLSGKALAYQYFTDLSEKEKIDYVNSKIKNHTK